MTTFTIPWIQDLAGATDGFDDDHWRLLDKVNTLLQAISSSDETGILMACSSLRVAAQEHFAAEEAKMSAWLYPDIEPHCQAHRRLLDSLSSLQFMLNNTAGFAANLGPFALLDQWFEAHLANDDRRLADFLARCTPPARFTRTSVDALSGESARTDPAEA